MSEYNSNLYFRLVENIDNNQSKDSTPRHEIATSRKLSVDYFTKDGFILRTGYSEILNWYLLFLREGLDNCIDFLWKHYRGENTFIDVDIYKDDQIFRIKIRNSNPKNISVFEDLDAVFDFSMRYGTKQDVHIISRGMLGDAMKQILSLGYILSHINDDGSEFRDKQWESPLIIRHNKERCLVYLRYDKAKQEPNVEYKISSEFESDLTDTEIELTLPIVDQVRTTLNRSYIERFCREYSILTTDISFKFRILDESTYPIKEVDCSDAIYCGILNELIATLSSPPSKGVVNIEIRALSSIASPKEWSNADSIHSYTPSEFTNRIINVHHKQNTIIYDVLQGFREGTNIKKNDKTKKTLANLVSDPNIYTDIENFFTILRAALPVQNKLSLPYSSNRKERFNALISRIAELYNIDKTRNPSYRIECGYYDDGIIRYPFAFEVLAIPFVNPIEARTKFIGAVNYSISPNGIRFEGEYRTDEQVDKNINELLRTFGFHKHSAKKSRLPCIIVGNLIIPRRDPHGYDKSRLDTKPFAHTIITAIKKIAADIPTLRAAGYIMRSKDDDYNSARQKKINRKVSAKDLLRKFLVTERGLPDV
jgi:hypothetical protein